MHELCPDAVTMQIEMGATNLAVPGGNLSQEPGWAKRSLFSE
jgi:hypothetical protein